MLSRARVVVVIALALAGWVGSAAAAPPRGRTPRLADRLIWRWVPNLSHAASVKAVSERLQTQFGHAMPNKDWQVTADRMLRRHGRIPASVLPESLPPLPAVASTHLAAGVIKTALAASDVRSGYIYLERQAAALRGSSNELEQQLGSALTSYLARYKAKWAKPWLRQQRARFAKAPREAWRFTETVNYQDSISSEQRAVIEKRIARAKRVLEHLVDPQVLLRMPPVPIQVGSQFSGPCIATEANGRKLIHLTPTSSVKDLLHELGHWVEDFGGWRIFTTMHALRWRRSDGRLSELGKLLEGTTYDATQKAFNGKFVAPYIGRKYAGGSTEVLSMGLERLVNTRAAYKFFQQDGEHLLLLLASLQGQR
ncbi:MAG: hypothetical protein KC503_18615 [Myxococcales bacterium]|nr:hypothetical protein [Myxococcales bacterium]